MANELEQAALRRVVFTKFGQVSVQVIDALSDERDLGFRTTGVRFAFSELFYDSGFFGFYCCVSTSHESVCFPSAGSFPAPRKGEPPRFLE